MASSDPSGLARQVIAAFLILAAFPAPAVAQSNQQITICQATGSQSNPWVFTTIDARDLSEHVARGDFRANSIADCPGAQAVSSPTPQTAVSASQARATATPAAAQPAAPAPATNTPAVARAATPVSASAPAERSLEVAGAEATPEPKVSTLPKSGDEPDRPLLVLVLLGLIGAGAGLRRLGRAGRGA